jgi:hypothetical protein
MDIDVLGLARSKGMASKSDRYPVLPTVLMLFDVASSTA